MTHVLKQYLMSLKARNYSEHTQRAYETDLTEYERFL
jgi:site-specific recombinase XerD